MSLVMAGLVALVVVADVPLDDPVWWLTNDTPPQLAVQGPAGPLRGGAEATLRLDSAGRARVVSAQVDGRPLTPEGDRLVVDTTTLPDGPHRVVVRARDRSRQANEAVAEWPFTSDNTPPALQVVLDPEEGPVEGHTLVVRVRAGEEPGRLAGDLEGRALELLPDGSGGYWSLVGIPPEPAYRRLTLRLVAADAAGNEGAFEQAWPLVRTKFPEEELGFDPELDELANQNVRALEDARLEPLYRPFTPRRWDGAFRLPVQGPITTDFATRRSYNGRYPQGNHLGTDIAAAMGTPVQAPAAGVVVFAAASPVRGNVLVLDHGAGVYSTYAHLQSFAVPVGAEVATGETIGRVGSTGLSTGPHLHWEIHVNQAAVEPLEWTERAFP
jgi:murein DD-endopeptidase MepM/ murein hydrolase activator NlpD